MNLEAAVSMGRFCGLKTVDECISNVERHSMSLFIYTEISKELKELHADYDLYMDGKYKLDIKKIDLENDAVFDKMREEEEEYHRNNPEVIGEGLDFDFKD